ncbi:MAG: hypothetical protein V7745_08490 [Pseudomonadales bacterium]
MKRKLIVGLVALFLAVPALADKPEWSGEGKPSAEQKDAHKQAMKAKPDYDDENDYLNKEKNKKDKQKKEKKEKKLKDNQNEDYDELKGLDKQALKKSEQERMEQGKGSDIGQEGREGSKKWWKFWE